MKRGFLFGLGSFLIIGAIAGASEAFKGEHVSQLTGAVMIAICASLSVAVIRKANAAQPNKSRLHAVGGWFVGFFIINAVLLVPLGLFALLSG